MAATSSEFHDSNINNDGLPLVFYHCSQKYRGIPFREWIGTRYRLLEPSDSTFPTLSCSVRVLLCVGISEVTSEILDQLPSLECVVGSSVGVNHIDVAECCRRGIKVTSAGDAFTEDVADYAVGLLIDVLRRLSSADRFVRDGMWPVKGEYPLGLKLGRKQVGIVGLGSIGSEIAKRLEAFGCIISYNSRKKKEHVTFPYYETIHDLARNSDALIVCCTLTNETHHLINKEVMEALGKTGVIVNVGRGPLIDEKELVQSLLHRKIGGAALDVFENEPHVPEELLALNNVVLSAHKAVTTPESFSALVRVIVGNLDAFFAKQPLLSEVEPI
ncbi:hypothetical protein ACET3Z_006828 [Daucus carota]